jgi:uncharacterized repeat protein (TIGR04138 family)
LTLLRVGMPMASDDEAIIDERIYALSERDGRYRPEAYSFVMATLSYTIGRIGEVRHVSGQELLEGLKELSKESYGPMAKEVLNHWGIMTSRDVGCIVFNLVSEGLLRKTDSDTIEDFEDGFDFEEEFITKYRW